MTNNTELERVFFIQRQKVNSTTGEFKQEFDKRYGDVRLDLSLVASYGHYINPVNGNLDGLVTEVYLQNIQTPFYIKKSYNDFHDLMQTI